MHYFEKWTTRIYQNIKMIFFCISVFPKFYAFTLKSNKNVPFRNAFETQQP